MRTPPAMAPDIEPSPPTITITNASRVYAGPALGVTSTSKAIMQPATATQAEPSPNVSAYNRFTSRPTTLAPSQLSAQARIAVPVGVQRKKPNNADAAARATRAA